MKKLLVIIISMLVLLTGCSTHTASSNKPAAHKQELIVKTYTVESIDSNGYYVTGNNEGVYINKNDSKVDLVKGNKVKVTFTKQQYETMESYKKVELIN